jgi:Domain of unknown function (DUF4388)
VTLRVKGLLSDRPWGTTLATIASRRHTGQLTIESDGKQFTIVFADGAIVAASSPLAADAIVRIAVTSQFITSTQVVEMTRRIAMAPDRDEVDVLAETISCSPEQASKLRHRAVAQRAARTFQLERGSFVLSEQITLPVVAGVAIDHRHAIYLGIRRYLSESRLLEELRHLPGSHFELEPAALDELPRFALDAGAHLVIEALKRGTTLPELEASHREIEPRLAQAVIYALVSCKTCKATARATPATAPRAATASPRGTAPPTGSIECHATSGLGLELELSALAPPSMTTTGGARPRTATTGAVPSVPAEPAAQGEWPLATGTASRAGRGRARLTSPREAFEALGLTPPAGLADRSASATTCSSNGHDAGPPPVPTRTRSAPVAPPGAARTQTRAATTTARPVSTPPPPPAAAPAAAAPVEPPRTETDEGVRFSEPPTPLPRSSKRTTGRVGEPGPARPAAPATRPPSSRVDTSEAEVVRGFAAQRTPPVTEQAAPGDPAAARTPTDGPATARVSTDSAAEAEAACRRGELAMKRDQPGEAILEFKAACELHPGEVDYAGLLAWAKFCAAGDKPAIGAETRKVLERAVARSLRPERPRFYLGRVERMLGRDKEALRQFQEVLELKPNHAEAASEVRAIEARLQAASKTGGLFGRRR